MQEREEMPHQARQNTHRRPRREPRAAVPVHDADVLGIEHAVGLVGGFDHAGREVEV